MRKKFLDITIDRGLYSLSEIYLIGYKMFLTVGKYAKGRKKDVIGEQFSERIMLAVTEVNDCPVCSYAHTKIALEAGMSSEEIEKMLSGVISDVPTDELPAIMFGQHYAEYRGTPTEEAWLRIVEIYGEETALSILGASRMIMFGNAIGIPWSSFIRRFKGQPDKRSTLLYEFSVVVSTLVLVPVAAVHALLSSLLPVDKINFD